jgi:hypothetical protein
VRFLIRSVYSFLGFYGTVHLANLGKEKQRRVHVRLLPLVVLFGDSYYSGVSLSRCGGFVAVGTLSSMGGEPH